MGELQVQVRQEPNAVVAGFSGDASVDHIDELEDQLRLLLEFPPGTMVFELSGVTYISSIGISALIRFQNQLVANGSKLKLAALGPKVAEAFRSAKLDKVFEIHPSLADALAAP